MKSASKFLSMALLLTGAFAVQVSAQSQEGGQPKLNCQQGPAKKTYGKTDWLVYSCDDNRSVVIVAAPGNPASPFVFTFAYGDSGYRLSGEGTGNRNASDDALDELRTLNGGDIADLIGQTRQPQSSNERH